MAEGSKIGPQGCVPLDGESNIVGASTTVDTLTLTQAASATGDFLVGQSSDGTERFYVTSAGGVYFAGGFGINGGTVSGTAATKASLSVVSGATAGCFSDSASWAAAVAMIQLCHDRLKAHGFLV
ncbi:MAG: hypothetical protein WC648_05310 [Candidatus Paceibacterota bacterium]|jgi:hypothetical protein